MNEHNKDSVICAKYINIKTSLPVYEVVVELQHTELGVLVYEEPDVMRQVIRQARLTRRHLVRVVGDNVQLSESFIVDMGRRADCGTVLDIPMFIHVCDGFSVRRVSQQFHSVCNDGFFRDRRLHCVEPWKQIPQNFGSTASVRTR